MTTASTEVLMMSVHRMAWKLALRYNVSDLPLDHEDLYQSAMLALHSAMPSYDPAKGKFSTWAYRQLWSGAYNAWEMAHWQRRLDLIDGKRPDKQQPVSLEGDFERRDVSVEDTYDLEDELADVLKGLPDRDHEVAVLMMQGYKQTEIADLWGVSNAAINERVRRIRKRLAGD